MPILNDFQKLCVRFYNCQKWWMTSTEKEHKEQEKNLDDLCKRIDDMYMRMDEKEKEIAVTMLEASIV